MSDRCAETFPSCFAPWASATWTESCPVSSALDPTPGTGFSESRDPPNSIRSARSTPGARHAVATPGDLLFHIRAERPDLAFELAAQIMMTLGDAVATADEVYGFRYFDERDLLGFVDGTENPTDQAAVVSIIGLYSNVLDGPGVISSQGGKFPIADDQLTFLKSELQRLTPDRNAGNRAVIIAVHHPPLSVDALHSGSTGVQTDLDAVCQEAGLWPDAVLSGHAHLYQRFTRIAGPNKKETPYITAGSGGFAATPPQTTVGKAPITVGNDTLVVDPIVKFGYLTVTCDAKTLCFSFKSPAPNGGLATLDSVCVNLAAGKILPSGAAQKSGAKAKAPSKVAGKAPTKTRSKIGTKPAGSKRGKGK